MRMCVLITLTAALLVVFFTWQQCKSYEKQMRASIGSLLAEVVKQYPDIREEELITVYTFFDNNLNISETARQLYVHRNTLVYRLEKIQKRTGLDVRVFEDALTFKIAMMVADHMKYIGG